MSNARQPGFWSASAERALAVVACGVFAAALVFVPPGLWESIDYVLFYQANFQFLVDALREGRWPLWNPYIGLGRPYLADIQNAVFYPPLYLVCLGPQAGLFLLVWLHCLIAMNGFRRLGPALGAGWPQVYFMAFTFLASGALTARWMTGQLLYCCGVCYVPALFSCAVRSETWDRRSLAGYAFRLGLQFLCGHPQVFWFSTLGQVAFILCRGLGRPWREALREAGRALCGLVAALVLCVGLVAVVLWPFLELVAQGNRSAASPAFVSFGSLEWLYFASLFSVPPPPYWIDWERNIFVGWPVLLAGLAGLLRIRDRNLRGLAGVLLTGLLISAGDGTVLFGLFYQYLPGFAMFRLHARAALLVSFALVCAAGLWLSAPHPRLRALVQRNFPLSFAHLFAGLVLLQALDSLQANWRMKRAYAFESIMQTTPDYPFQAGLTAELRRAGWLRPHHPPPRVCIPLTQAPANVAMIHGYASFDAYTSLFLRRPWEYLHAAAHVSPEILRNTSVSRQVYDQGPFPYPDLDIVAGMASSNGILRLASNPAPRAFVVFRTRVAENREIALSRAVQSQGLRETAWVEQPLPKSNPEDDMSGSVPVQILHYAPNSILLDLNIEREGLLVLTEAWYPGWQATVGDRVIGAIPVNFWMRGFPVPAGRHRVRVFFRQRYLVTGGLVSMVSLGFVLALSRPTRLGGTPPREDHPVNLT